MFILSAVLWVLSWVFVTCLNLAAARQVRGGRSNFLHGISFSERLSFLGIPHQR
jgi:hypothetical protein